MLKDISNHCRDPKHSKWTRVDGGFRSIYASHGGLVCGIKDSSLYIRKHVTHEDPLGSCWVKQICDVVKVILGKKCLLRKTSRGYLHMAKVDLQRTFLDWKLVPPHDGKFGDRVSDSEHCHHVVDDGDRLFAITASGEVFCCELLTGDFLWDTIAAPPPPGMSQGFVKNLLLTFWREDTSNAQDWVGMVSAGGGSIWCLREGTKEVWQLVISWLNSKPKVNWTKVDLPLLEEEEVVSLSACKSAKDRLYVIVKEEGYFRMVSCSFSAGKWGRVELELPVRYPCRSMGICSVQAVDKASAANEVGAPTMHARSGVIIFLV